MSLATLPDGGFGGRFWWAASVGGFGGRLRWAASVGGFGGRFWRAVLTGGSGRRLRWAASGGQTPWSATPWPSTTSTNHVLHMGSTQFQYLADCQHIALHDQTRLRVAVSSGRPNAMGRQSDIYKTNFIWTLRKIRRSN